MNNLKEAFSEWFNEVDAETGVYWNRAITACILCIVLVTIVSHYLHG